MTSLLRAEMPWPMAGFLLKDKNLEAARGQRPGDRKSDHASADDNGLYLEHRT